MQWYVCRDPFPHSLLECCWVRGFSFQICVYILYEYCSQNEMESIRYSVINLSMTQCCNDWHADWCKMALYSWESGCYFTLQFMYILEVVAICSQHYKQKLPPADNMSATECSQLTTFIKRILQQERVSYQQLRELAYAIPVEFRLYPEFVLQILLSEFQ